MSVVMLDLLLAVSVKIECRQCRAAELPSERLQQSMGHTRNPAENATPGIFEDDRKRTLWLGQSEAGLYRDSVIES
jgi:hypothetical protein